MALLTAAERNKLPDSDFAYIDSKGNRKLPVHDAEHVRDALSRFKTTNFESAGARSAARSRIQAAAKRLGVKPSADFSKGDDMEEITLIAEFAADEQHEEGDDVVYSGRLFRAGDYPEVSFSLTPAEVYETIRTFMAPAPMDFEHKPSVFGEIDLTGQFGSIDSISADEEDPEWLRAVARKPKWLHEVMPETKVSATFRRRDKALVGAAWTATPIVKGAELVAAFAESVAPQGPLASPGPTEAPGTPGPAGFAGKTPAKNSTPTGQMHMQMIHDRTVSAGAVCNRPAQMASRKEASAIQQAHDITAEHGAVCETHGTSQSATSMPTPLFAETTPTANPPRRRIRMNILDLLRQTAKDKDVELEGTDDEILSQFNQPAIDKAAAVEAELAKRDEIIAELRKSTESTSSQLESERRGMAAATFAKEQINAHRLAPALMEPAIELHARLSEGDSTATFAEGEKSTTVLFEEFVAGLPDLSVFAAPQLNSGDHVLNTTDVTAGTGDEEVTEEDVKRYLAMTPLGQQVLASKIAAAKNA